MSDKKTLEVELRDILETEGSLTDEQCSRVDVIEADLDTLEIEARTENAREVASKRLTRTSFGAGDKNTRSNTPQTSAEAYAKWALTGETRGLGDQLTSPDTAGGYAVPLDLQDELITVLNGVSGVRQCVDSRNYNFDVQIAQVADRPSITNFTGENTTYDAIGVTFGQVRSYAFKSAAESFVSEELAQDARPAVIQEILAAHAEAHGLFWDGQYAIDGAGAANGPEKICGSDSVTGLNVVETAASGVIDLADLMTAYYTGLPAQYRGGNFSWLMHPTVEAVLRADVDGNDRFQLMPQALTTFQGLPSGNILGMPVVISTNAPTLAEAIAAPTTKSAVTLMDRSSYRIFDRLPMTTQRDEFSKGSEGMVVFRSKLRSDGRWLAPYRSVGIKVKA